MRLVPSTALFSNTPGPGAPIALEGKRASHFEHVYDFYKPNLSRYGCHAAQRVVRDDVSVCV
jgi:hypothetical protein